MPLSETAVYPDEIYQLELTDPLQGGPDGVDNLPHRQLANRTAWLKAQVLALSELIATLDSAAASLESPAFSGAPTAPTPPADAPSTRIATAGFVRASVGNLAGFVAITGPLSLGASHIGKALRASGSNYSITLPPASSVQAGAVIDLINYTDTLVINRAGEDTINDGDPVVFLKLAKGDSVLLVSNGGNAWQLLGGSLHLRRAGVFAGTFTGNGYMRSPSGHIVQFCYAPTGTGGAGSVTVNLPIAFPTGILSAQACSANGAGAPSVVGIGPGSTAATVDVRFGAGTLGVFVQAIGY